TGVKISRYGTIFRWFRGGASHAVYTPGTPTHEEAALLHGWGRAAAKDRVEASGGLLHLHQELGVALGVLHLVQEQLDGLLGVERVQHPTQLPDDVELLA